MKKEWLVKTLAFGIIVLFVGAGIVSAFNVNPAIEFKPMIRGNWLYVGGNGTGNYSKIQDAIDNASDGDTVYVFGGSSPYYENIVVNVSIDLIGEDKNITVVDGGGEDVISILADFVKINRFTIQHSGYSGIKIHSNFCSISDNLLKNNINGILLYYSNNNIISNNSLYNIYYGLYIIQSDKNNITHNFIFASWGIWLDSSSNNTISGNKIISENKISIYSDDISCLNSISIIKRNTMIKTYLSRNSIIDFKKLEFYLEELPCSIECFKGSNNLIIGNYFSSTGNGILTVGTINLLISRNTIIYYWYGIGLFLNFNDSIICNNFFKNHSDLRDRYALCIDFDLSDNLWDGNYFNRPRLLPKPIIEYKIIRIGRIDFPFPWVNFDWHPAKKPYDTPVGK